MKKSLGILLIHMMGLLTLTACASTGKSVTVTMTPSPQPTATAAKVLPTPASPSDSIVWRDMQVTMEQIEITENFVTEFGSTRNPPAGDKFMWVRVHLKNVGQVEMDTPVPEHFSVLYAASELKPTYGHRKGYPEYFSLDPVLFPNDEVDAWLRFDIPVEADLKDLRFVFIPESSQVGTSFSSPEYPYAENRATFVWKCGP